MSGTCSVDGCGKPNHIRDLCNTHYHRMQRNGDPVLIIKRQAPRPRKRPDYLVIGEATDPATRLAALEASMARQIELAQQCRSDAAKAIAMRYWVETAKQLRRTRDELERARGEAVG
jgi:hypothetical protein